ncbi:MAG: hypothetical protein ABSG95_06010 [Solirubrobacteraceae bacterium]
MGSLGLVLPLALLLAGFNASTAHAEEAHSTVTFTCSSVTFTFAGFPNAPNNKVRETVYVDGVGGYGHTYTFNGPSGENTVKVAVPPGHHKIDGETHWKTNGVKGGSDQSLPGGLTCGVEPGFSIVKLQKFANVAGGYTTSPLPSGHEGQTVDYEILVTNTGNVPLTFSSFSDPRCDEGTITGGPGETPVAPSSSTTYFCTHLLTKADHEAGVVENIASVTGTPPEGDGPPITDPSNPVLAELPTPTNTATFSCTSVTFTFSGFPNTTGNTVRETIYLDGAVIYHGSFTFNGSSASNTVEISVPPGHHKIDGRTQWKTNGFKGGLDLFTKTGVNCE